MSLANLPTYTNGNKTITITMKSNFKWSNGQPVTSKDLLFDLDLIKAGVKESPSNWASYVPGHFPDDWTSASTPNSSTLVLNLSGPVNPGWFTDDILSYASRAPCRRSPGPRTRRTARSWTSPTRPTPRRSSTS